MLALRLGSTGPVVTSWQRFLRGQGIPLLADGEFGPQTHAATVKWQRDTPAASGQRLQPDGVVGAHTARVAVALGWALFEFAPDEPRPLAPLTVAEKDALFGRFEYKPEPTRRNPERVRILGEWRRENLLRITLPKAGGAQQQVWIHRVVAEPLQGVFEELEQHGLVERVVSIDGGFASRFVRGSRTVLSNHAYGSAIDLNAKYNRRGTCPAEQGEEGSVRELVPVFARWGFFWGGHYRGRPDGMHFEYVKRRAWGN